ncbi:MAG: hypothetical protein R3A44_28070 [Caldilineaceae bacterium]
MSTNANTKQLLDDFKKGLSKAWFESGLDKRKSHSLFELYIFKLVLEAAQNHNAHIAYKDGNGSRHSVPTFGIGPHTIYNRKYIHAELQYGSRRILEVHIGAQFKGKSDVEHECDVAVLRKGTANLCRKRNQAPKYSQLILSAECKFYTANIGLGMSREFVGLTTDLTAPRKHNFYVVSSTIVASGKQLLNHHSKMAQDEVVPSFLHKCDELVRLFEQVLDPSRIWR